MTVEKLPSIITFVLFALGLLVSGCRANGDGLPTVETQYSMTEPVKSSATITQVPTNTVRSETETPLPTQTTSLTPMPTLTGNVAEGRVLELYKSNDGCQFPCFWGFTPGHTKWIEARNMLAQFAQFNLLVSEQESQFYMDLLVPIPDKYHPIPILQGYWVEDGLIKWIVTEIPRMEEYSLSNFLLKYGRPDEVWISTYKTEYPSGVLPFLVVLFYQDQGILANFGPKITYISNDMVHACQMDDPPSLLGLWSPDEELSFMEAARRFRYNPDETGFLFVSLQEAVTMDEEEFTLLFSISNSEECISTPKELWPEQQ